jgi:hypothetical protein
MQVCYAPFLLWPLLSPQRIVATYWNLTVMKRGSQLHIAVKQHQMLPSRLDVQHQSQLRDRETEVSFRKRGNWYRRRYYPKEACKKLSLHQRIMESGSARPYVSIVASGHHGIEEVQITQAVARSHSDSLGQEGKASPNPNDANGGSEANTAIRDSPTVDSFSKNYLRIRYQSLSEALQIHMKADPPPRYQYFHMASRQAITMGEWMLCGDWILSPSNVGWKMQIENEVGCASLVDVCALASNEGLSLTMDDLLMRLAFFLPNRCGSYTPIQTALKSCMLSNGMLVFVDMVHGQTIMWRGTVTKCCSNMEKPFQSEFG